MLQELGRNVLDWVGYDMSTRRPDHFLEYLAQIAGANALTRLYAIILRTTPNGRLTASDRRVGWLPTVGIQNLG